MEPDTNESAAENDSHGPNVEPDTEQSGIRQSLSASRRQFLAAATTLTTGLAGCTSSQDAGSNDSGDENETRTSTEAEGPSTTPGTRTSTETEGPSTTPGTPARTGDEWVTFQNDFQRSGYAPNNAPPSGPVTQQWRTVLRGAGRQRLNGQPILAEGKLFTASRRLEDTGINLYALDEETGEIIWQTTVPSPDDADSPSIDSAPTYHDGSVYYYTNYSRLVSVDAADGSIDWQTDITPAFRNQTNSPVVYDGAIYVVTDRSDSEAEPAAIKRVDPETGAVGWSYSDAPGVFGDEDPDDDADKEGDASDFETMALGEGTLYAAAEGEGLYAVKPGADVEVWEIPNSEDDPRWDIIDGSVLAFADGTVYLKAFGTFSAIEASSGSVEWSVDDGHRENRDPYQVGGAVANGAVYYTTAAGTEPNLRALDTSDGSLRWEQTPENDDSKFMNSPVLAGAGETVLVSTNGGIVEALDASSGEHKWNFGSRVAAESVDPVVANGAIYIDYGDVRREETVVVKAA